MDEDVVTIDRAELSVVTTPSNQVVSVAVVEPTVVTDDMRSYVTTEQKATQVVAEGQQGPAGPPGEGATAASYLASTALSGHRMVYLNSDHKLAYATNTVLAHAQQVLGMTTGAIAQDALGPVIWNQELQEPSWAWVVGAPIYLGENGALIQSAPTTPAVFSLIVGWATASDRMFVSVGTPIILS